MSSEPPSVPPSAPLTRRSSGGASRGPVGSRSGNASSSTLNTLRTRSESKGKGKEEKENDARNMSSAAFLHHLHTDPSSHHVCLSGAPQRPNPIPSGPSSSNRARVHTKGPENSPQAINVPLEPTVMPINPPAESTAATGHVDTSPRSVGKSATHAGELSLSPPTVVAGPSRPLSALRRSGSKRSRPNTAPGRSPNEQANPFGGSSIGIGSAEPSPEIGYGGGVLEGSPFIPAQDDDGPAHQREISACSVDTMYGGTDNVAQAMEMMTVSGGTTSSNPPTRVFGRADDTPATAQPGASIVPSAPSPPPQLSWRSFGLSYAHGLFEPNKIPNPPIPEAVAMNAQTSNSTSVFSPTSSLNRFANTASSSGSGGLNSVSSGDSGTTMTSTSSAPVSSIGSTAPARGGMAAALAARKKAYELETIPQTASPSSQLSAPNLRPDQLHLPNYSVAAATMRMASSHLQHSNFAPLGVPSPERELMDPMSSIMSPSSGNTLRDSASSDPGSSRNPLSRSVSSAIVPRGGEHLPTITASPAGTPLEHPAHNAKVSKPEPTRVSSSPGSQSRLGPGGIVGQRIPPATAPVEKGIEVQHEGDYFGTSASPHFDRQQSHTSQSSSNRTVTGATTTPSAPSAAMIRSYSSEDRRSKPPSAASSNRSESPPPLAYPGDVGGIYEKFGWLAAPLPPDEIARRKALYRFNILHTSPDVNFDRIAHMAKLVFNTKIVLIALIDGEDQWHKSHTGLGTADAKRISSFCSHTLLVSSGEPFVVLDAKEDWRFVNNPQVVGPPNIRFYAGAPLRTADGHNLGSLCIIDDKPRTEFPPRSRLILKEFAAVTMREMELWRDKLQLRIRDKIQTSMEKFTRECLEMDAKSSASNVEAATRMDQVYARASSLVCSTLDMDGCIILDLGQFEMVDVEGENGKQSVFRADPYSAESTVLELSGTFGPVNAFPVLASTTTPVATRSLTGEEHRKMSDFLTNHRDGRIFENVAPSWIRYLLPSDLRYGMVVPIFGVNQQPFAMIVTYSTNKAKQYLEGYELQFIRAIGVIILSAVLRRRMVLADKTKSVLISSVSHELRTPLHGILAAAELLSDTTLDSNQIAFLKTVQTCGNTLIETVNHVLDFTKLSGSSGSSSEGVIKLAKVNLASLVEQTVEGVWIGQRARYFMGDADIGSFYAPPTSTGLVPRDQAINIMKDLAHVETVIDIGYREKGWMVRCERGGLRRVLMNLVGNSLKFTKDGYVQITLKELPHSPGSKMIPVEMAVIDTGKGIGKDFLKDQLFHPFSQENPLQTGTGLGLAIVNSIVRSENVNGKVDVWSSEGAGTEIRVSLEVEVFDDEDESSASSASSVTSIASGFGRGHSVSFIGYDPDKRGNVLALEVLSSYTVSWHFDLRDDADIEVLNDDEELLYERQNVHGGKALILLSSTHSPALIRARDAIDRSGGLCQIVHKPIGPTAFRQALHRAVLFLEHREGGVTPVSEIDRPQMSRGDSERTDSSGDSGHSASTVSELSHRRQLSGNMQFTGSGLPQSSHRQRSVSDRQPLLRRRSEEQEHAHLTPSRPAMAPRGLTYHHGANQAADAASAARIANMPGRKGSAASDVSVEGVSPLDSPLPGSPTSSTSQLSTISLADGGVMLKAATRPSSAPKLERMPRVMVVEDNVINRRVLGAFLKKRNFEWAEAHDGQAGVSLFEQTPANYWDVILMDISMPIMNGHDATSAIRKIEASRRAEARAAARAQAQPSSFSSANSQLKSPVSTSTTPTASGSGSSGSESSLPTLAQTQLKAVSSETSSTPSPSSVPGPVPPYVPQQAVHQSRVKIFALTGLATADDKRQAFGSGVDGYLVKPVSLQSLDLIFKKIGY